MIYKILDHYLKKIADEDIEKCFNVANIQQVMTFYRYYMLYTFDT